MSLLPEDVMDLDSPAGESAPPKPSRRRNSIQENLRRNALVDSTVEPVTPHVSEKKKPSRIVSDLPVSPTAEPFWDRKSIVFVSWYWPSCILVGIALGFTLADLVT